MRILRNGKALSFYTFNLLSSYSRQTIQRNGQTQKDQNKYPDLELVAAGPMSNLNHIVRDIHDILESYYKVARKRFVDPVCMQATDYYLLTGEDSPLKVFSPLFISKLSSDQLEMIAGEDIVTKRKRKRLKKEIADLEARKNILV